MISRPGMTLFYASLIRNRSPNQFSRSRWIGCGSEELQPDLILMDLSLPGMNGIDATRQILIHSPRSKVLFVSEHRDSELIQAAFEVGACGYVLKSDSSSDLILGIRTVLLGQPFVSRSLTTWRENLDQTY
jgi:DNA-binding NarL/FixJ family response regulator